MKSEQETAAVKKKGEPNIPGPRELPDQQKVGEPSNDQKGKTENTKPGQKK